MIDVTLIHIIVLLCVHFLADFILQTRVVADNKGKDIRYLMLHGAHYTATWLVFLTPVMILGFNGLKAYDILFFGVFNGGLHVMVDFITSKFTSKFYARKNYSAFFNVIGFDQFIHAATIILTYNWLLI